MPYYRGFSGCILEDIFITESSLSHLLFLNIKYVYPAKFSKQIPFPLAWYNGHKNADMNTLLNYHKDFLKNFNIACRIPNIVDIDIDDIDIQPFPDCDLCEVTLKITKPYESVFTNQIALTPREIKARIMNAETRGTFIRSLLASFCKPVYWKNIAKVFDGGLKFRYFYKGELIDDFFQLTSLEP